MPVPEERLYRPDKLNRWFALSSIVMTASIVWMIVVDYDRPWRAFQSDYFTAKAAVAHLTYLDATREERRQELDLAKADLAAKREHAEHSSKKQRADLETELAAADLEFRKIDGEYVQNLEPLKITQDTYEKALAEHGEHHSETRRIDDELRQAEEEVDKLRGQQEHWGDEKRRLELELSELNAVVRAATKVVEELEKVAKDALLEDQQFRGVLTDEGILGGIPIVSAVINAPLLDFTAPWTTRGRQTVKQLVLPEVRQRLNYLESYTTDRCTTCHVAIDDPQFARDALAKKLESSLTGINDALQRLSLDPLEFPTPPELDRNGQALPAGSVTDHWDELTESQQDEYFDALLDRVNTYMKLTGRKEIELGQPILAHPHLNLYIDPASPHPMNRVGCTVCHEGNPQETDFVQAVHTPPTHEIRERWEEEYYIHAAGIPNITFETVEHYWDRPMRLPQYSEAGCTKCHEQIADISRFEGERHGQRINLGRQLFTEVGCINCHLVQSLKDSRMVGPNLRRVASKLEKRFVQQWIDHPQGFRPSTRMPHFFRQENNGDQSANQFDPDPTYRTETEVAAITQYLYAVSDEWSPIVKPDGVTGDVERGRQLFRSVGCLACHANLAEFGEELITQDLDERLEIDEETALYRYKGMTYPERVRYAMEHFATRSDSIYRPDDVRFDPDRGYQPPVFSRFGPELSGIGSKVKEEWLYSWVMEPKHYAPDTIMPSMRLLPDEAADLVAYLLSLKFDGFKQFEYSADARRQKEVKELIFTLLSAQRSERRSRTIIQDEGQSLTNMLVALLEASYEADPDVSDGTQRAYDLISGMSLEDRQLTYLGNKMIAHYGCYTCHEIRGFEGATPVGTELTTWAEKPVSQLDFAFYDHAFHHLREENEEVFSFVYPQDAAELNLASPLPDDLREQITHTPGAFAKHKMLNPRIWDREKIKRPYDKLKMPNFYFTEEEAEALTTYLLSRVPPRVSESLKVDYDVDTLGPIARGRHLTRELNCVGCHQLEDNAPTVQQYFRRETRDGLVFDELNAPPRLWGQGAKVQPDWLSQFFNNVETLRPWLRIRMPSFNLSTEQTTDLVAYFASLSQRDAEKLAEALAPVEEYIGDARKRASTSPDAQTADAQTADEGRDQPAPGSDWPPGSDWYEQDLLMTWAANLRGFALDRKLVRRNDFDTLSQSPERIRNAYQRLLEQAKFMKSLYDVKFPFGEPPLTLSPDDRFDLSQAFFNDMGCLKCHVFGNMVPGPAKNTDEFVQMYRLDAVRGEGESAIAMLNGAPYPIGAVIDGHTLLEAKNTIYEEGDTETTAVFEGPAPGGETERIQLLAPTAPNLGLTYKRLRRAWVEDWMLQPNWMQPGTKMPQNFADGVSSFLDDPKYPGTSMDHLDLLVDYLYEAGAKGVRSPLLKIVLGDEDEDFDEDEEFDEDEFD